MGGQVSVKSVLFSPAGWIRSLQICTACYCNSSHSRCSRCSSLQRWVCKGEVSMGASLLCSGIQGALIHYSTCTSFPVSLSYLLSHACTCMHDPTWKTWMHGLSLCSWAVLPSGVCELAQILASFLSLWFSAQRRQCGYGLRVKRPGLPCQLLALWLWAGCLITGCISLLIHKVRIT